VSPEPRAGSADVFVDELTELLDAHVVRPRPAVDADPDAPGTPAPGAGAALLAALSAPATWGEPPADLRDTVLARVLGRDAGPGKAGDAEPEDEDEPIAATAAPTAGPAMPGTAEPERNAEAPSGTTDARAQAEVAPEVAEPGTAERPGPVPADGAPEVTPAESGVAELRTQAEAAPEADEPGTAGSPAQAEAAAEPVPGTAEQRVAPERAGAAAASGDGDEGGAVVRELRPRWRRLAWAVPVAAAAAAVFTVAVLGVQQALEPDEPVGVTYSAAGTQLAPDASAEVTVAKAAAGFSVVIDVKDLPAAAPGSYYSAWLRGPDGVVPLGSFHARQVAKPITLWSGVDPARYQTFSVTLQREGAPPTPSGVAVLRGTLSA
jgi:hypothetical protein